MADCKPGMRICGKCEQRFTCGQSPYIEKKREIDAWAWQAYNRMRASLCMLTEEKYAELSKLLRSEECAAMLGQDVPKEAIEKLYAGFFYILKWVIKQDLFL